MKHKSKILVVEDTKHWRNIFVKMLSNEDYYIEAVGTYADANYILSRQFFDLVILDIRLSEGDTSNLEGMKVLREIRTTKEPTNVIIVSGYSTVELTREAFKIYNVLDFVEKDRIDQANFIALVKDGVTQAQALDHSEKSFTKTLFFEAGLSYNELVSIRSSDQDIEGLLHNIFTDLWPLDKKSLGISKLIQVSEGKYVAQVLGWSKAIGKAIAVRIGSENIIKRESKNYNKQKLDNSLKSSKQEPYYKTKLGGVVYILESAPLEILQDFSSFYRDEDFSRIILALNDLFLNCCLKLYTNKEIDKVKVDLSSTYHTVTEDVIKYQEQELKKDLYNLSQLDDADRQDYLQADNQKTKNTSDPIEFIQKQSFIFESPVAIVHGDLHGENIIVDSNAQTWLVGFYETDSSDVFLTESDKNDSVAFRAHQAGKRNLLHDFATLEVSIRKTLTDMSVEKVQAFDLALCKPKQLSELQPITFDVPELDKAYIVITRIRELAVEILADFNVNVQLYYVELLFQFLKTYMNVTDPATKDRLWTTISVLTDRLDHWD